MKQQLGVLLQFVVLVLLPMTILWQLQFGFEVFVMPICLLIGIGMFWVGSLLRNSTG